MSNMKYSGVEWIGEIPKNWNIDKLKYCINEINSGGTPESSNMDFYDDANGIPWVAISDMSTKEYVYDTSKKLTSEGIKNKNLKIYPSGTLLYSIFATIGKTSFLKINAAINQAILAIIPNKKIDKLYLKYQLNAMEEYVLSECSTNTQNNLNSTKVKNFHLVLPKINEQKIIANFLDEKVSNLDSILFDLNKQIEILINYKKSLILEKVKKGMNENVELKESGINWVGRVPSHWKIKRIKDCNRLQTGTTPKDSIGIEYEKTENNYQWYTPGDYVNKNYILDKSERVIDKQAIKDNNIRLYPENTILLVGIGATVGKIAFIKEKAYANQQITAIIPSEINYKYELYYLISKSGYIKDNALYTTLPILNNQYLGEIKIIFPPLDEQKEIVDYLDRKCKQIDKIIEEKQKQIEKIEEYKKSVIYEYVTGKKRVEGAEELYG